MVKRCMLCTITDKARIPVHICGQHCGHFPECGNTNPLVGCNLSNCVVAPFREDPEDCIDFADTIASPKGPWFKGGDLGDYGTPIKHEQRIHGEHALKEARERNARDRALEERKDQPLNKNHVRERKKEVRERERKESRDRKQQSNQPWS